MPHLLISFNKFERSAKKKQFLSIETSFERLRNNIRNNIKILSLSCTLQNLKLTLWLATLSLASYMHFICFILSFSVIQTLFCLEFQCIEMLKNFSFELCLFHTVYFEKYGTINSLCFLLDSGTKILIFDHGVTVA